MTLVLDGVDGTLLSPVNVGTVVSEREIDLFDGFVDVDFSQVGLSELLISQIEEKSLSENFGSLLGVEGSGELDVVVIDLESVGALVARVLLVVLGLEGRELGLDAGRDGIVSDGGLVLSDVKDGS